MDDYKLVGKDVVREMMGGGDSVQLFVRIL